MSEIDQNIAAQRDLYGQPLGVLAHEIMDALDLTQAGLAKVVGLSAPMLSQLISGRRVKIGNPAVLARLEELTSIALDVRSGRTPPAALPHLLSTVQEATGHLSTTATHRYADDAGLADGMHRLLRAVASGQELRLAAQELDPRFPELAELIRVYGLGTPEQARAHLQRFRDAL